MTLLKASNVFLFQIFFIRLTRCRETIVESFDVQSYDLMSDGNFSARGTGKKKTYQWFSFQMFIVPFTGWFNDYIFFPTGPIFIKLTKKKEIDGQDN